MRKSTAPSRKFISPAIGAIESLSTNENLNLTKRENVTKDNRPTVRSTKSILDILKNKNVTPTSELSENSIVPNPEIAQKENICNTKIYNVVWRKQTAKKHKTWEEDGVLEIKDRTAILKNLEYTEIGRVTNIKLELIKEGYILSIGSKDVQILDLLPNGTTISKKRSHEEDQNKTSPKTFKKPKTKTSTQSSLYLNSVTKRKHTFSVNYQPLVMPQPNFDHQWTCNENKKPIVDVSVDPCLAKVLRPHQRLGVIFLYECVMGYKESNCFGAILADEMGLGKTLQCITLIWTLLKQGPYGGIPIIKRVLIVAPSSLTGNWEKEFLSWLGRERIRVFVVDSKNKPKEYIKMSHIPVLIISYEMFVRSFEELNDITFDLLICDEGHRLKNNSIKAAVLLKQLNCKRRIILTGTPIQNDLQEFYSLTDFVNPEYLGSNIEYRKYFEEPIVSSREPDIDEETKNLGSERAKELNKKTKHFILRRTQDVLEKYLPTKTETVIFCKSSHVQQNLYSAAIELWENRDVSNREIPHLSIITALKKICNHPHLLRQTQESDCDESISKNLSDLLPNSDKISFDDSGKLKILLDLLKNLSDMKERIVIVSSYTQTLDMIANVCGCYGYKYSRLDGSVPSNQRTKIVDSFNNQFSSDLVFLLSAKAGGVGLNLIGASRLVLFDSDWNPATDLQAMSRVWRDGQKKSVFLYRFLTTGTIEEKIYQRQISKTGLSGTVVDPNNTKSIKMSDEELKDLFSLQFDSNSSTHLLLNCDCLCDGSIPEPLKNEIVEERSCQLGVEKSNEPKGLKMNQLMQWEHHKQPFDSQMLKELGLNENSDQITFIFRNKCSL